MTHDEWMTLLAPVLAATFGAAALLIGTAATGLNAQLKSWLAAKAGAAVAQQEDVAFTRIQTAAMNEAGSIALEIGAGHLDVTDLAAVKARAAQSEAAIKAKLPDAVDVLKPVAGSIAGAVLGKLGNLAVPTVPNPAA